MGSGCVRGALRVSVLPYRHVRQTAVRRQWALVLMAVAAAFTPLDPAWIEEWYSRGVYPRLQAVVTPTTNRVPVALLDVSVALLVLAGALLLARGVAQLGARKALIRSARTLLQLVAVLYLWFLCLWGLNYRRVPLEQKLDWDPARITGPAAVAFAETTAVQVNARYVAVKDRVWDSGALERAFGAVQRSLGAARVAVPGVPKPSLATLYFRRAAIDGMTNPFFLEIILNPDVLDVERPYVMAHEWAHLAGYADESEANFIAWLACIGSDPLASYSGWLAAYEHAVRSLPAELRRGVTPLAPGPREDLRAVAQRYRQSSPAVREAAQGVYDSYLRANRIEEGIGSYEAVVKLMLGTRFDSGWTPGTRRESLPAPVR